MKKALKVVGSALLLLVVFPLAAWIGWNVFDDKLDPRAAAYGAPRAVSVPEAENGYYAAIAMNAPDGADGIEYAKAWVAERRAAAKKNRAEKLPAAKRAKRPIMCDATQVSCVAEVRDKQEEVTAQLDA